MTALTSDVEDLELQTMTGSTVGHLPGQGTPTPWTVTDERSAEHALRRIGQARLDLARRTAVARELLAAHQARIAEIEEFIAEEEDRTAGTVEHFEALLTGWHRRRYAEDPKHSVSIRLSGGVLKSRAAQDRVEVADDQLADLALHAEEAGADYARWEPKVDRRKLLAWIKDTGEVPAGARLIRATDDDRTFRVEVPDAG